MTQIKDIISSDTAKMLEQVVIASATSATSATSEETSKVRKFQPSQVERSESYYSNLDKPSTSATSAKSTIDPTTWSESATFTERTEKVKVTTLVELKKVADRVESRMRAIIAESVVVENHFDRVYRAIAACDSAFSDVANCPIDMGGNLGDTANYGATSDKGKRAKLVALVASQKKSERAYNGYLKSLTDSGLTLLQAKLKARISYHESTLDTIVETRKLASQEFKLAESTIVESNKDSLTNWYHDNVLKETAKKGKETLASVKRESRALTLLDRVSESFCLVTKTPASWELSSKYWELVDGKPVKRTSPDKLYVSDLGLVEYTTNRTTDDKFVELVASQVIISEGVITGIASHIFTSATSKGRKVWTPSKRKTQTVSQYNAE